MLFQVFVELKRITTYVARERPVIRVDGHVPLQRMVVDERFAARTAHEVPLVPVPFQMAGELGPRAKRPVAECALVAADAKVHQPVVDAKRGALRETFATRGAYKRFLAGVRAPVIVHVALLGETTAAHVARILLDPLMHGRYVPSEPEHGAELFVAHVTHIRFLARVRPIMVLKPALDRRTAVRTLVALIIQRVTSPLHEPLIKRAALA